MLDKRNFYINGKWTAPIKSNDFQVINPSNEEPCAIVSLGGVEDVNSAVKAAKEAFQVGAKLQKMKKFLLFKNYMKFINLDGVKWQNRFLWKWGLLLIGLVRHKHHLELLI